MSRVAIIGFGNVGHHFRDRLSTAGHDVQVFSRTPKDYISKPISALQEKEWDFILLTVPDDQILKVSQELPNTSAIVLHTSGSRPLQDLALHPKNGVLYPLQTFSKNKTIDFLNLQVFVEGSSPDVESKIRNFAVGISPIVATLSSDSRAKLHLAAVFACNFSNHMFHLAEKELNAIGMTFQDLKPLLEETLEKALTINPSAAQTGPAIRQDHSTISKHIDLLMDSKTKKLYKLISESIQNLK